MPEVSFRWPVLRTRDIYNVPRRDLNQDLFPAVVTSQCLEDMTVKTQDFHENTQTTNVCTTLQFPFISLNRCLSKIKMFSKILQIRFLVEK